MATVPASHTFVNGVALPSEMNAFVRDPIGYLLNLPRAELRQTVSQNLATATPAPITFTTADLDTDIDGIGGHDTVTNPSRYTARYPGWYQVSGAVAFATNSTGRRASFWSVNGVVVNSSQISAAATSVQETALAARTKHIFLAVGDYVELIGYQDSGSTLATPAGNAPLTSSMTVRWVSN